MAKLKQQFEERNDTNFSQQQYTLSQCNISNGRHPRDPQFATVN